MKKIYSTPILSIVRIEAKGCLLADSYAVSNETGETDALVKERSGSSTPSYNVWDDDWSR